MVDRITASGRTWKGYMEDAPRSCPTANSGFYYTKHDPFVYYNNVRTSAARCANVVPYTSLAADLLATSTTPNYAFITPNQCNDMHDCSIATGDNWLRQNVPQILNSPAFTRQNSLLMLVWDEDDSSGNNKVAEVMVGSSVKRGYVSNIRAGHYGLLRTIEAAWSLSTLTANDGAASPMSDMFISAPRPPSPTPTPSPTLTPTPTAHPTPRPTPSSTPINGAPCTVTFPDGTQHTGTCSGTYTG
jgi:phosphatidylinositol-3-phosphatase